MIPLFYRLFPLSIYVLVSIVSCQAQERLLNFRIVDFREIHVDESGAFPENGKLDGDGMPYAIIEVTSETPGDDVSQYDFNFFNMRHETKSGESLLWVYVQRNAKNVTVSRPGYASVVKYSLNPTIEAGKKYQMVISAEVKKTYKQPVRFDVTPENSDAFIMVRRQSEGAKEEYFGKIGDDGVVAKNLVCGLYEYKVMAKDYDAVEGVLILTHSGPEPIGPVVTENVEMSLNSNTDADHNVNSQNVRFDVTPTNSDAVIMLKRQLDGAKYEYFGEIGKDGVVTKDIKNGLYDYKVMAKDFITAEGVLAIDCSDTAPVGSPVVKNVSLLPNCADVTFDVDADADIYIDGERKGLRHLSEKMEIGQQYEVECRQEGCRPTSQTVIVRDSNAFTVDIKAPVQITGYVSVTSSPLDADISIAGKSYGQTPMLFELPVGSYSLTLSKVGWYDYIADFDVNDGETSEVFGVLNAAAKIKSSVSDEMEMENERKKYKSGNSQRIFFRNTEFYVAAGLSVNPGMGVAIALGGRFHKFNVEIGASGEYTKGNEVMWAETDPYESYIGASRYSVNKFEVKAGYQMPLGNRMMLTPQVGYLGQQLSSWGPVNSSCYFGDGAMCHNLLMGANLTLKISRVLGVFVNPAFAVPVSTNDIYSAINANGGPSKGGFSGRAGLELSFGVGKFWDYNYNTY